MISFYHGESDAKDITDAHERSAPNRKTAQIMDLHNNSVGRAIGTAAAKKRGPPNGIGQIGEWVRGNDAAIQAMVTAAIDCGLFVTSEPSISGSRASSGANQAENDPGYTGGTPREENYGTEYLNGLSSMGW